MEEIIEKYKIQAQTLLDLISHSETSEVDREKAAVCRRFVRGFITDLEHLERERLNKGWESLRNSGLDKPLNIEQSEHLTSPKKEEGEKCKDHVYNTPLRSISGEHIGYSCIICGEVEYFKDN